MKEKIRVKHGNENLSSHSGLLLIGQLIKATMLKERLEQLPDFRCLNPEFSNFDIIVTMIGLICIGKPDYDAIEIFRPSDPIFAISLGLSGCPSSPTLRQRIDSMGHSAESIIKEENVRLIRLEAPAVTPIKTSCGEFVPLDSDVSPFDNSKTKKEGVSRTYKEVDGFAPIFSYLGTEGYLVNLELRPGSQHCQKDTPQFLDDSLSYARQITQKPILVRLDSGNDSKDNFDVFEKHENVHFIIKRNIRRESPWAWLNLAKAEGELKYHTEKKSVWIGKTAQGINGQKLLYPIAFEVTERQEKKGQTLLFPELEVDTYWCSLEGLDAEEIVSLYHDHGTSEQFHSELKSDMGLERLPSGRFSSNSLVLHIAMLSYNMLRIIGQLSLQNPEEYKQYLPTIRQKKVSRRRIRTVMQDFIYIAGRLIDTARMHFISFGKKNCFSKLWEDIYLRLGKSLAHG